MAGMRRGHGDEYVRPEVTEYGSLKEMTNQSGEGDAADTFASGSP